MSETDNTYPLEVVYYKVADISTAPSVNTGITISADDLREAAQLCSSGLDSGYRQSDLIASHLLRQYGAQIKSAIEAQPNVKYEADHWEIPENSELGKAIIQYSTF